MHPPLTDADIDANEVKEKVLASVGEISVLPSVAAEALQMARDPECSTAAFSALIEKDIKLAAEILAFSNSPLLGGRNNTTSLKHAVVRLGFRQCRNLIMSSCASSLMKELNLEEEWIREILWHHSHTTATACTILNRVFDLGFNGEEFTTGLLHDFGRLLFAIAQPEEFRSFDKLDMLNDGEQLQREQRALSIDHCQIAAWFLRYSHLPEDIVRVIELHHTDSTTLLDQDPQLAKLVGLLRAGDHLANHLQVSDNPSEYDPTANDGLNELAHSKGIGIMKRFSDSFNEILKEITANVGEKP